ncbi:flagellar biosynthesis regulator FlaF [Wenxinia saemankumensis]|uniref:Flagellar protein FlaF n=1 Tax=Wenxinia saemankumensis TaxID=1447782 RepID=A0A1M6G5M2_9RHOB|nr:flagellar biosynthesis regulator FlaF [Wenxinia saemankumensis]SHJ05233.1 flagellar protein FlaF [Wenxinia saemankumensis]
MTYANSGLAQSLYGAISAPTRTARDAERQVLIRVTAALRAASGADFPTIVRAVHDNRMLWTRLAADVAGAANGLPQPLRARLFYLAEFTEHHSRRILSNQADLEPLVEINTAVIRGLAGTMPARQGEPV